MMKQQSNYEVVIKLQCTKESSWVLVEKVVNDNYTGFKKRSINLSSLLHEILIY